MNKLLSWPGIAGILLGVSGVMAILLEIAK